MLKYVLTVAGIFGIVVLVSVLVENKRTVPEDQKELKYPRLSSGPFEIENMPGCSLSYIESGKWASLTTVIRCEKCQSISTNQGGKTPVPSSKLECDP